ncbi:MAG: hypothetical protein WB992_25575 [Bryobacteraceae bacterium]
MIRALLELLFFLLAAMVARAVLSSLVKGYRNRAGSAGANGSVGNPPVMPTGGGDLHKDPVCGTFVSEATPFRQQVGRETFFYCSNACREKHALVAR